MTTTVRTLSCLLPISFELLDSSAHRNSNYKEYGQYLQNNFLKHVQIIHYAEGVPVPDMSRAQPLLIQVRSAEDGIDPNSDDMPWNLDPSFFCIMFKIPDDHPFADYVRKITNKYHAASIAERGFEHAYKTAMMTLLNYVVIETLNWSLTTRDSKKESAVNA